MRPRGTITRPQSATARDPRDVEQRQVITRCSLNLFPRRSNADDVHALSRDRSNSQNVPENIGPLSVTDSSRLRSFTSRIPSDSVSPGCGDPFDEAMEEYVDTIRVAGHQALALAKKRMQSELKAAFYEESRRVRQQLLDRDGLISSLQHEVDTRKHSWVRVSKQLRHMADLLGTRGASGCQELCRARTDQEVVRAIVNLWIRKANALRKDRIGTAFVARSYDSKLILRVYSAWRVSSITQSVARSAAARLDAVEVSKEATIDRLTRERDKALAEIDRLCAELDEERSMKDDSLNKIESLLAIKFKDFTQEISRLGHKRKPAVSSIDSSS